MSQDYEILEASLTHGDPLRFPISAKTDLFRQKFFPGVSDSNWNNWQWQLTHRIDKLDSLERVFALSNEEKTAIKNPNRILPLAITPYYASLLSQTDSSDALRRTLIPDLHENFSEHDECLDPLGEDPAKVTSCLVHRYPDRALFLAVNTCATYCRYCNRARMVGQAHLCPSQKDWDEALAYLRTHTEIRDVLISGGDPLILADHKIDWLLTQLRTIKHIEFLRIGTKVPVSLPQRITRDLVSILKKFHPLWLSIHVIHPSELTEESSEAFTRIADAGLPMGSQTVLLKEVNDTPDTMKQLMHGLLKNRITPYALFQLDVIKGSARFRTSIEKGLEILSSLQGHTSGYAVPSYIIDPPGGGGKVQLTQNPIVGRDGDYLLLKNFEGKIYRYYDGE